MGRRGARKGVSRKQYDETTKNMARYLYEMDGTSHTQICAQLNISHPNIVYQWKKKDEKDGVPWVKNKYKEQQEAAALNKRLAIAEKLGIDEVGQMMKARELMHASKQRKILKEDKNNKGQFVEMIENVPDYKHQNEGLKRAMELTGTKIDRREVEHTGSAEIVHHYKMPQRQDIRDYRPPQIETPDYEIEGGDENDQS